MLLSIFPGRDTVDIFESTGEMQLIGITNHCADFADGVSPGGCFRDAGCMAEFSGDGRRCGGACGDALFPAEIMNCAG